MSVKKPAIALDLVKGVPEKEAIRALRDSLHQIIGIINDLVTTDPKTGAVTVKAPVTIPLVSVAPNLRATAGLPRQLVSARRPGSDTPTMFLKRDRTGTDVGWDPVQPSSGSIVAVDAGGSGADLSASGPGWLRQDTVGGVFLARDLLAGDIPDLSATYQTRAIPLVTDADLIAVYPAGPSFDGWLFRVARVAGVSAWRVVCCGQRDGSSWDWFNVASGDS